MHHPRVNDILFLPEEVYDRWVVTQVFNQEFNRHLKDYMMGDVVFVIRPLSISGIDIPRNKGNLLTKVVSMLELKYQIHTWETQ